MSQLFEVKCVQQFMLQQRAMTTILNDFIGFDFICYFPSFTFDIRPTYLHVIISISLQGSGLFYYNRTQNTYTTNKILYVKAYALRFDFKFFCNRSIFFKSIFSLSRLGLTDPRQPTCLDAASKSQ